MELIAHFGFAEIANMVSPYSMYRMMVEKAFADDDRSAWADALRRCWKAFEKETPYRMTQEWDDMIA